MHDLQAAAARYAGKIVGLAGISRDLQAAEGTHPAYSRLAAVVQHIQENYVQPLNMRQLAQMANMSIAQLERYFHKVFHLTPRQVLLKTRLDAATALLVSNEKVTDVAALCGYTDHSAFTRQFKATVGITPSEYRALLQAGPSNARAPIPAARQKSDGKSGHASRRNYTVVRSGGGVHRPE